MRLLITVAATMLGLSLVPLVRGESPEEIERLIRQLSSSSFEEREKATSRLRVLGEAAAGELRKASSSSDAEVRYRAREILAGIKGQGIAIQGKTLNAWTELLSDGDLKVRRQAASALGQLGSKGKDALPDLRRALGDKETSVRWRAALAMWRVDPSKTREALDVIKKAADEMLQRLPALGTEADVKETEALLAAALEVVDGKR